MCSRYLLYGPIALALAFTAACRSSRESQGDETPAATWQQRPLIVDGMDNDWVKPLPGFSKRERLSFAITNDAQNVYVLISTKDPLEQQKIIEGGMTVWVNTKADKTQADAIGIGYPLDSRMDHDHNLMEEAQPDRYKTHRAVTLEDKKAYALYGVHADSAAATYAYLEENPQGIEMRMDYNKTGELIYEAAFPLAVLYPGHSASASYAAKSIAVGIFVDGLPPDAQVPRGNGGSGVGVGVDGGLGFGSFGSGGGIGLSVGIPIGGGGGGDRSKQLFKDTELWQIVRLTSRKRGF